MARPKEKESRAISVRLNAAVVDRLEAYCETSGQTKTLAIERALNMFIDNYDNQQAMLAKLEEKGSVQP